MRRPTTKQSRAANASEKRRMAWLKERALCSACGARGPVINHHAAGSAGKVKVNFETVLIGHAFVLSLCQTCDDLVTHGSRRRLTDTYGSQAGLWLAQERDNPEPAPMIVQVGIARSGY